MSRSKSLTALALAAGVTGCVTSPVTIAPSTQPLQPGSYRVVGPAEGSATGVSIFGIPVTGLRQMGDARDEALKASGGDALIDVVGDHTSLNLLLVTIFWTTVEGQAVELEKR